MKPNEVFWYVFSLFLLGEVCFQAALIVSAPLYIIFFLIYNLTTLVLYNNINNKRWEQVLIIISPALWFIVGIVKFNKWFNSLFKK